MRSCDRDRTQRLYYTNRIFMGVCCVSAEVVYLAAHAATDVAPGGVGAVKGPLPKHVFTSWLHLLDWLDPGVAQLAAVADTAAAQLSLVMVPG